jgi:hypothetical protein
MRKLHTGLPDALGTWKVSGTPVGENGLGTVAACGATVSHVDLTPPAVAQSTSSSVLPALQGREVGKPQTKVVGFNSRHRRAVHSRNGWLHSCSPTAARDSLLTTCASQPACMAKVPSELLARGRAGIGEACCRACTRQPHTPHR